MKLDDGSGVAGISVFQFEIWVEVQLCSGGNCGEEIV